MKTRRLRMATWPHSQRDPWALRVEARGPLSSLFSLCRPNSGCGVPHPRVRVTEAQPAPAARADAEATREAGEGPSLPTPFPASSIHRWASTKYLVTPFQASFCSLNRAHCVLRPAGSVEGGKNKKLFRLWNSPGTVSKACSFSFGDS